MLTIGLSISLDLAWSPAAVLASLHSTPIISKSSLSVSYPAFFRLPILILPSCGIHCKAKLAALVDGSHRLYLIKYSHCYCVMQCHLSRLCYYFIISNVVTPRNAQNTPKAVTMKHINLLIVLTVERTDTKTIPQLLQMPVTKAHEWACT